MYSLWGFKHHGVFASPMSARGGSALAAAAPLHASMIGEARATRSARVRFHP